MGESRFQARLIKRLHDLFPGCVVLKNDPSYLQGVPDLIVLYGRHWAVLECKAAPDSRERPNQDYYVEMMDRMSFAAFINPSNEEDVLYALQRTFEARRYACISES